MRNFYVFDIIRDVIVSEPMSYDEAVQWIESQTNSDIYGINSYF